MIWIAVILVAILSVLIYIAHQNTFQPELTQIELKIDNNKAKTPLHVLHLSDLHMEKISVTPDQLYDQLKDKPIDLIALTGDYLDRVRSIDKFLNYLHVLKKLDARYGVYAVFGNHDYVIKKHIDSLQMVMENAGVHVLVNENHTLNVDGQIINIIGIDDNHTKRSDIEKSYRGIKDGINLVLTHDPNLVLKMDHYHFDYLLSGHFHGGQIHYPKAYHLIKMGKLARRNIIKGLHFHQKKPFYISEGLGQTGFNIRLRSKPEITLHTLT